MSRSGRITFSAVCNSVVVSRDFQMMLPWYNADSEASLNLLQVCRGSFRGLRASMPPTVRSVRVACPLRAPARLLSMVHELVLGYGLDVFGEAGCLSAALAELLPEVGNAAHC